jgi:hypothetical protein
VSAVAFLSCRTLWAEKIQSTIDAGSLNTFGRNEIEVAPIFIGTSSHCVFSNTIQNGSFGYSVIRLRPGGMVISKPIGSQVPIEKL